MNSGKLILIVVLALSTLSGCGLLSKKYLKTETIQHKINIAGKKKVKIDNITGNVTFSHSDDSASVIIKATKEIKVKKKYLNTPFDEITVELDTLSNIISIKTEISKKDEGGFFQFNINREQRVDYEILVPSNIAIEVENVHGNIIASNLSNDINIDVTHGEVSMKDYTGKMKCDITNGSFSGEIDSTSGIDISIVNGGATLNLNNYMNANVRAETVNGKITNEELRFRDIIKERNMFKGKLGTGDSNVDIKVETVNGKIKLYGRNEI